MQRDLFDRAQRRLHRDRAVRRGVDLFLLDRAFDDCRDRIAAIRHPFELALLIGAASPDWADSIKAFAPTVDMFDPSPLLSDWSGDEDRTDFGEARYDLVVAVGTLDSVNDLPAALRSIRRAMRPGAALVGAMAGGDTLPSLRAALLEADRATGRVVARVHPRIDGPTLTQLLSATGFDAPVVDIDRVRLRYKNIGDLVRDLRAMGATSALASPRTPLGRSTWTAAAAAFEALAVDGRTEETVEIIHFAAWAGEQG